MDIPLITGSEDGRYGLAHVPLIVEDLRVGGGDLAVVADLLAQGDLLQGRRAQWQALPGRLPSVMTGTRLKRPDQVALEAMPAQLAEKGGSLDSLQARGSWLRCPRAERVGLGT